MFFKFFFFSYRLRNNYKPSDVSDFDGENWQRTRHYKSLFLNIIGSWRNDCVIFHPRKVMKYRYQILTVKSVIGETNFSDYRCDLIQEYEILGKGCRDPLASRRCLYKGTSRQNLSSSVERLMSKTEHVNFSFAGARLFP